MAQTLSELEQGIFDLVKIGSGTSLVSGVSAALGNQDFRYTFGCIMATSFAAGLGLLTELGRRAYESKNQRLSDYDWKEE
jgi:hypothetical protein